MSAYTACPEWQEDGSCIHSDHMAEAEAAAYREEQRIERLLQAHDRTFGPGPRPATLADEVAAGLHDEPHP